MMFVQPDGRAAGQTSTGNNLLRDIRKKFRAGMRIGIHKNQPVPGRRRRAGIARAGDLVDRLEHDNRARRARDFRRAVGRVVVAHDQFNLPAALRERTRRRFDLRKRFAEQPFFVERRNDDGNFHRAECASSPARFQRGIFRVESGALRRCPSPSAASGDGSECCDTNLQSKRY